MIDTLSISKQLQESGLSAKEADAIAMQMGKLIDSDLASKQNLKETELTLQRDIEEVRLTLQKEIEEVRLNLQKEIEGVKLSLQKEIEGVKLTLQKEIDGVRLEIKNTELRILDKMNSQLKWVVGFLVGQAAVIVTLIKLLGE